jgi:hypothetical protein
VALRADFQMGYSPTLTVVPGIDFLSGLILGVAVTFLEFAFELILLTVDYIEIVIR